MKTKSYCLLLFVTAFLTPQTGCAGEPENFVALREQMVQRQITARGVKEPRVLEAMRAVPRHLFVPERFRAYSYEDEPLPIGRGQTISQPYIVAYMTEALELGGYERVLEIGTGSGYQAAILAELVKEVYTIEIIDALGKKAREVLQGLGYKNIHVMIGDGYKGWPEKAPFDAVIVTCAPEKIPAPLVEQLKEGGRMIIPVGPKRSIQKLVLGTKEKGKLKKKSVMPVRFVPMVKGKP